MPKLSDYNPAVKYGANLDVNVDLADIRDANDNELLELDTVASAVNYIRIANAATGSDPELSVQGDDTNADLQLTPLGTGVIFLGTRDTATEASGSATLNAVRGRVTTSSLTTQGNGSYSFDLVNDRITTTSVVLASVSNGNNTGGTASIRSVMVGGSGSANITISNEGTASAINGTLLVNFVVL